ncbi:MAG: hypothetical protein U0414_17130 [Polyangiaceae bacterium]
MHPWMFRFGFPGFAETEWVLPAGVAHDDPAYVALPRSMACQDFDAWCLAPELEGALRDLHEAALGEPLLEPAGMPFHQLMAPLRAAFEREELVAWVLRASSVSRVAELPKVQPKPQPQDEKKTWIEIVLRDEDGAPVPNEPYVLTLVSGEKRKGSLDERGFARIDGIDPGTCDVTFPKIDGREWRRA